ncbi:MAG TPA: hypothetical protein VNZ85_06975 [Caulobacter sp.]|nr:hypothetical protein [Caulobacter sp.]
MTPSQTTPTPQPGDYLVAAIEAQTVAIERAMVKAFWTQIVGLTVIMSVAMTVFVVAVKAG